MSEPPVDNGTWAIIYLRPDGWWLAGHGWITRAKALKAARAEFGHESDNYRVVLTSSVGRFLCNEAKEAIADA